MKRVNRFTASDHLRHAADPPGRTRDSLFWQTVFGPQRLGFQTYLYLTSEGKAGLNVVLWGEGKPMCFDRVEGETPASMDLDDFRLDGLSLSCATFGGPARLSYDSQKVSFDFTFEGRHAPFSYHDNPDGLPAWFAQNRYEQGGTVRGWIQTPDVRLDFDQPGHRDQSWGNRNWGMPQHWKWFCAYTPDGSVTLNGWIWMARGEMGCAGFVCREGLMVPVATIQQHATYDEAMGQQRLNAVLIDVDGGRTAVVLERFGLVKLPTRDKLGTILQEAACVGEIDGRPAVGQFETHWHQAYIDHLSHTHSTS
jgi:hypothetical protein